MKVNCSSCSQVFDGRRHAKTCSSRCRKRLQRMMQSASHLADEVKIEVRRVEKSFENSAQAVLDNQGGYIAGSTPVVIDNAQQVTPAPPSTPSVLPVADNGLVQPQTPVSSTPQPVAYGSSNASPIVLEQAVSSFGAPQTNYTIDSSLEVHKPYEVKASTPEIAAPFTVETSRLPFSRRKALIVAAIITGVVTVFTGAGLLLASRNNPLFQNASQKFTEPQDIVLNDASLGGLPAILQSAARALYVNGDIIGNSTLKVTNGSFTSTIKLGALDADQELKLPNSSGTICLDSNNCQFASTAQFNQVQANSGVVSVGGLRGAVGLGNGLTTTGNSLTIAGNVCTTASVCSGYQSAGSYVNLQASFPGTAQSGNLNISGSGAFGGNVVVTALGTADTTTQVCRNTANQLAACSSSGSGSAFVQDGNSFGSLATLGTNDANDLAFETNGMERLRIDANGNVGIGITNPTYKLQVSDVSNINSGFDISSIFGLSVDPSSAPASVTSYYGSYGTTVTAGSNINGNVLAIGSAGAVVHNTTGTLGTAVGAQGIIDNLTTGIISSAYATQSVLVNPSTGSITNGYNFFAISPIVTAGSIGTSYGLYVQDQKVSGVTNGYGIYQTGANDINYFAGNTGIGTATPGTNRLYVNALTGTTGILVQEAGAGVPTVNGAVATLKIASTTNSAPLAIRQNSLESATPTLVWFETSNGNLGQIGSLYNNSIGTIALTGTTGKQVGLAANGSATAHLLIDTSGNVGIGTVNPTGARLQVEGGHFKVVNSSTAYFSADSAGALIQSDTTGKPIQIYTRNAGGTLGERVRIDSEGNVGIGVSPSFKLDVSGDINASADSLYRLGGSGILTRVSTTNAVLLGDTIGNARGTNALDLQSIRTAATQVASGTDSVAIGVRSTASGYQSVTLGNDNTASNFFASALGPSNTATNVFSTAIGAGNISTGFAGTAIGTINYAVGSLGNAFGYENSAIGDETLAIGGRSVASGLYSLVVGGTQDGGSSYSSGANSIVVGGNSSANGNDSLVLGKSSRTGYPRRAFTVTAGATALSLAGGDYTAEYGIGDTVIIVIDGAFGSNFLIDKAPVSRTVSSVSFSAGTTTLTISSAIDGTTTGGAVVSQSKAQRSGAVGYTNIVTANDAYALGSNITNSLQGSVQIGTSDAGKLTITSTGGVGIGTATLGTNNRLVVNPYSTVDNLATTQINTNAATNKGLVVQGFASQTADLQQWQDSTGTPLTVINSSGSVGIGTSAPLAGARLHTAAPTTGTGTISVAATGTTVTGTGTNFLSTFMTGDTITANGETRRISAIASNTSMTTEAWTNTFSGAYTVNHTRNVKIMESGKLLVGDISGAGLVNRLASFTINQTNTSVVGGQFSVTSQETSASTTNFIQGINVTANIGPSNTQDWTSSVGLVGIQSSASVNTSATGTISNIRSFSADPGNFGSGTATNVIGYSASNPSGTGTITNNIGLRVDNLTRGSNNTSILLGTTSAPSGNFGIYNASAYNSYFAGNVGIGTTSPGNARLAVVNATMSSGALGTFTSTQTAVNATDTLDMGLGVAFTLSASSATNELVQRGLSVQTTNSLTGGGAISNMRTLSVVANTSASTTTTDLDQIFVQAGTASGTVTNNRGLLIGTLQGTNRAGVVVDNIIAGTNRTYVLLGTTTIPTGNFGIYNSSTFDNYLAGSVGIGAVPSAGSKLEVVTSATNSFIFKESGTPGGYNATFQLDSTGLKIGHNSGSRDLELQTNSTTRLTVTSGGDVGIGTTTPGSTVGFTGKATLDVVRSADDSRFIGMVNVNTGTNASASFCAFNEALPTAGGCMGIGGINHTVTPIIQDRVYLSSGTSTAGLAITTGSTSQPIIFGTNFSEIARFSGTGNLGVGTASPSGAKQVNAIADSTTTSLQASSNILLLVNTNTTNNNWGMLTFGDNDGGTVSTAISTKFTDHTNDYGELHFSTRGSTGFTSRLVIDTVGNVGIGTTNPQGKLHVSGGKIVLDNLQQLAWRNAANTANIDGLRLDNNDSLLVSSGNGNVGLYDGTTSYFERIYNGATLAVQIHSNGDSYFNGGNVGIGTTTIGTNNRLIVNPYSTVDNLATAQINTNAATNKGLVVQGFASQSADLQQWQDSTGAVLAKVSATGAMSVNSTLFLTPTAGGPSITSPNNDGSIRIQPVASQPYVALGQASQPVQVDMFAYGFNQINSVANGLAPHGYGVNFTGDDITHASSYALRVQNNSGTTTFNVSPHGSTTITNYAATDTNLVLKGAASQTADLLQIQDSSGNRLLGITSDTRIIGRDEAANAGYIRFRPSPAQPSLEAHFFANGSQTLLDLNGQSISGISSGTPRLTLNSARVDGPNFVATSATAGGLQVGGVAGAGFPVSTAFAVSANQFNFPVSAFRGASGQTADLLQLQNSSGTTLSVFDASGNLGVGTASVDAKLHVLQTGGGGGTAAALRLTAGNNTNYFGNDQILFSYAATSTYTSSIKSRHNSVAQAGNALDFYLWNQGVDAAGAVGTKHVLTLDGTGNVGIGLTDPLYRLHVKNSTTHGVVTIETGGAATSPVLYLKSVSASGWQVEGNYANTGNFAIERTDGSGNLTIPSGNLAIGQTTADALLSVAGIVDLNSRGTLVPFATDNVQLRNNYKSSTDRLWNTGQSGWAVSLGDATDSFKIYRAPATAGAPVYAPLLMVNSSGNVGINNNNPTQGNLAINQIANGNTAIYVKRNTDTSPTGNFFQFQDAASADIATLSITGALTVKTATINGTLTVTNGHFKSTQTTAPTIGTPTNCGGGTGPSAAVTAGSTDSAGSFTITAGSTGSPTTCDTVVTFNIAYGAAPKSIVLTSTSATGGNKFIYISASGTTTFTVKFGTGATNPANSEANTFNYWVVE